MKSTSVNQPVLIDTVGTNLDGGIKQWFRGIRASLVKGFEQRAVMRQLASLDDQLLRDIGIADDEISRVRRRESFTPRAWR